MVIKQDAVAGQQLTGIAHRLAHFDGAESFGQRSVFIAHDPGILHLRQAHHHALGRGDVAQHAHQ